MSLRAFISPDPTLAPGSPVTLCDDESHYLARVRRAKSGAACELLDRGGKAYAARIEDTNPKACRVVIESILPTPTPGPAKELWLGLPDAPALLAALSRATELGATRVLLLSSRYSQGRMPSAPRIARCLDAAMRQCGRPEAPPVQGPLSLEAALAAPYTGDSWVASPAADVPLQGTVPVIRAQRVAIGPEGGFSQEEQQALHTAGFLPLRLGPFVLRTEVAVTAALAMIASA